MSEVFKKAVIEHGSRDARFWGPPPLERMNCRECWSQDPMLSKLGFWLATEGWTLRCFCPFREEAVWGSPIVRGGPP